MKSRFFYITCVLLLYVTSTPAVEIAKVEIADSVELAGEPLILNGAGIRKKLFFKIYVGSLYLPTKAGSLAEIAAQPGPKRVLLHFIYDEVSAEKLNGGWQDGFKANFSQAEHETFKGEIEQFMALFTKAAKAGDTITVDYLPASGTEVRFNSDLLGSIAGDSFYNALLRIWIGAKPASKALKKGMLGL